MSWRTSRVAYADVVAVQDALGVSEPVAWALVRRGLGDPEAAREFGVLCTSAGLRYVDAPVAGSLGPAAEGTLGVLVGGAVEDYEDALPLLHAWGAPEKVRRVGEVGAGRPRGAPAGAPAPGPGSGGRHRGRGRR